VQVTVALCTTSFSIGLVPVTGVGGAAAATVLPLSTTAASAAAASSRGWGWRSMSSIFRSLLEYPLPQGVTSFSGRRTRFGHFDLPVAVFVPAGECSLWVLACGVDHDRCPCRCACSGEVVSAGPVRVVVMTAICPVPSLAGRVVWGGSVFLHENERCRVRVNAPRWGGRK
jgi:hypothetical protein